MNNIYHVTPNAKGGWNVIKEGASRSSKHTDTKEEALKIARELSESQKARVRVHNKNGQFAPKAAEPKQTNQKKVAKRERAKSKTATRNTRLKNSKTKRSSNKDNYII